MEGPAQFQRLYRYPDFYLLRAPALPASIFSQSTVSYKETMTGDASLAEVLHIQRDRCYQHLRTLAAQPDIALALAVASPSLEKAVARLASEPSSSRRTHKTFASLLRYITRMNTRPTPFGLFSGVAVGTFTDRTNILLSNPPIQRIRSRPDMAWILDLPQKLENDGHVMHQLIFRSNPAVYMTGDRVTLHTYKQQENRSVSLQATSAVRKALDLARHPVTYAQLCDTLMQAISGATFSQVDTLFWRLWEYGFLLSDLHPPLSDARPADYMYDYLARLEGTEEICRHMRLVLDGVHAIDASGINAPLSLLHEISQHQASLTPATPPERPPVQIDAALQLCSSGLQRSIGDAAAFAAELLLRLSPAPEGRRALQEYRRLFIERYGDGAEVPLCELLSAEDGLDVPQGYELPPRTYRPHSLLPPADTSRRDRVLQKLVATAIHTHSLEIELTEQLLQQLEHWSPKISQAPYSLEIYLQVHASSREALDRGEWCAVVGHNYGSMAAGRTFGRFFDILGQEEMKALQQLILQEEGLNPQAIFAELSYQPRHAHVANVMIRPSLRAYEIGTDATPAMAPEGVIPLHDLVVGVKNERFYLRSLRFNKQVIICQSYMLNVRRAPNVYRFIAELAYDGLPLLDAFFWGNSWFSPFLPRIAVRFSPSASIVLSPAQWFVEADTIVPEGLGDTETCWFRGVQAWRALWRVPRYVYLTEPDTCLLLDLEHSPMVAELHSAVARLTGTTRVQLQEVLPGFNGLWLHDERGEPYFSEIVVPLLRADAPATATRSKHMDAAAGVAPVALSQRERCIFPGEDWLFFKLYAASKQHNKVIALHIRKIVEELLACEFIDTWFFMRYADPEPHIRLRFHTKDAQTLPSMLGTLLPFRCSQSENRPMASRNRAKRR